MSFVKSKSKEQEGAEAPKQERMNLPTPVRTEQQDPRKAALYKIVANIDAEAERGIVGGDIVQRRGAGFVLTEKADQAVETISIPNQRPEVISEAIDNMVWDERTLRAKIQANKSIANIWKAISTGRQAIISFKSEESADLAYDVLLTAGFTPEMLKRPSKRSIKIVGLPEEFNMEALDARLAKNLTRVKEATVAAEKKEAEETRAAERKQRSEEKDRQWKDDFETGKGLDAIAAAQLIADTYNNPSPVLKDLFWSWYYLNFREDRAEIVAELKKMWPFSNLTDREFSNSVEMLTGRTHSGKPAVEVLAELKRNNKKESEADLLDYLFQTKVEKPLEGIATLAPMQKGKIGTGKEHEELKAYERERRGGKPSELEASAATPWKIPKDFRDQLERRETTLFYTFPSAARYAEARATVEALYPGRAVSVEHTPEIQGGRDVGEWVMTVRPPGEAAPDAIEVSGAIRTYIGSAADSRISWTHNGKRESLSFASVASDTVSNYSTYTTEVMINSGGQSEVPPWFRSIAMGKNADKLDAKPAVKRALLEKGVELRIEVVRTIENDDDTTSFVYRITLSGENVRKPLEVARNEARSKQKEQPPELKLKRIASLEQESYAERMRRLKEDAEKRL